MQAQTQWQLRRLPASKKVTSRVKFTNAPPHVGVARLLAENMASKGEQVKHTGGCHCGAVRFEVWAAKELDVYDCKYARVLF